MDRNQIKSQITAEYLIFKEAARDYFQYRLQQVEGKSEDRLITELTHDMIEASRVLRLIQGGK